MIGLAPLRWMCPTWPKPFFIAHLGSWRSFYWHIIKFVSLWPHWALILSEVFVIFIMHFPCQIELFCSIIFCILMPIGIEKEYKKRKTFLLLLLSQISRLLRLFWLQLAQYYTLGGFDLKLNLGQDVTWKCVATVITCWALMKSQHHILLGQCGCHSTDSRGGPLSDPCYVISESPTRTNKFGPLQILIDSQKKTKLELHHRATIQHELDLIIIKLSSWRVLLFKT